MRLIDADALIEHIKDIPTWWADGGGVYPDAMKYPEGMYDPEDIISCIDNEITIEAVEVVHGEWIMRGGKTYCSKCGKLALRDQDRDDWWYYVQSDFCPHCGCKMGGAE